MTKSLTEYPKLHPWQIHDSLYDAAVDKTHHEGPKDLYKLLYEKTRAVDFTVFVKMWMQALNAHKVNCTYTPEGK